ncbi:MAG TPA: protease complex subunit PrcB family protein, partial [Pyrinomonadaceae bacterium]|nr:protease complex subunit PrcB family protein [Pyrinomonadaceae bacterium]
GQEGGRAVELITNENEWRRAWAMIGGGRPLPEINFNSRACIVVYQGQKPTGGYSIEIEEIRRDGTVLAVKVKERRPAFGDVTTQVITSPFVAVSISRPPQGASVRLTDDGKSGVEPETQQNRKIIVRPRSRRRGRGRRG